jgi:polysaccharide export outer membrane protein
LTIRAWLGGIGRPVVLALGLGAAVAGCQVVPGDGPWMNGAKAGSTEAFPFDVIDLTPTTVVAYRPTAAIDRRSTTEGLSAGTALTAAPGDVLQVRIFERYAGGTFPTIDNPGAADLGNQMVTPAGTIEVPYVGTVKVAGLRPRQIERDIEARLAGKAKEPQVIVEFAADRTNTIMVSGNVKKPGRMSLIEGVRTVVDAINRAGGAVQPAAQAAQAAASSPGSADTDALAASPAPPVGGPSQFEVVVRRRGQVILNKQLSELLAGGDIAIERGDEIVVRPNSQVVTVLGAVAVAGNVPVTKPNMTLADALGEVHGLFDLRSNKTGLYVFRLGDIQGNPQTRARIFRLDFMQPVSVFVAQQFGVQPKDVIFVANAPLREYDKVLDSLYRTAIIVGVVRGSVTPAVGF